MLREGGEGRQRVFKLSIAEGILPTYEHQEKNSVPHYLISSLEVVACWTVTKTVEVVGWILSPPIHVYAHEHAHQKQKTLAKPPFTSMQGYNLTQSHVWWHQSILDYSYVCMYFRPTYNLQ
jgi:hypothetical protein